MNSLTALLFQNDHISSVSSESLLVLPNVMEGIDIRTSSGEVIASMKEDVFGTGVDVIGSNGEKIASVSENVWGGTKIDYGGTEVVNGYSNVYGGETYSSVEGLIGFSKPSFEGGMDYFSSTGEKVASINPDIFGGTSITTPIMVDIPYEFSTYDVNNFAGISDMSQFVDVHSNLSLLDTADSLEGLDIFSGLF